MPPVDIALSATQTLLSALDSPLFNEIRFIFGYSSELLKLKDTVSTARAVLLDAQAKLDDEFSYQARDYIHKLKYAVYDADDLLDKFATLSAQKQQLQGGNFSKEVRAFFSHLNQLGVAYTMSRGIKEIRKTLDAIAYDHARFGFGLAPNVPIRRRNKKTCSWVNEKDILGRDDDKKVVIDMLLDHNVEANVSFVTIVGTGGLGKTALAQLVYNDKVIESVFPLRMWVCISDQDPKRLDIEAVLYKILESATKEKPKSSELETVQQQLRKVLEGKKYLLVLDDVWIEDRNQCLKLGGYLMGGQKGSRILVTSRSKITAKVIGSGSSHVLQGLSEENSWHLFKRLAFEQGQTDLDPAMVEIGKQILKKCANVPLAIRMMGTLLYGKSKMEWQAIQRKALAIVDDDITYVLKLSYYHLDTHLKSCFSYCAVFPKDYVMFKKKLISLWMAQGYLESLDETQSLHNAGEECFSILLGRCFFQDVETDDYGEIVSCKMHDIMHDIAIQVAGNEIHNAYSTTSNINKQTHHVFAVKRHAGSSFRCTKIRTYLNDSFRSSSPTSALLKNCKYLRVLDLQNSSIRKLPCAIGRLLHLRYLDLSRNYDLKRLPEEITKLYNLQTLLLMRCDQLKKLPSDLSKLAKLRVLDMEGCDGLRYMPCGLDKLTGLCILTLFVVGQVKSSMQKQGVGTLEDIASLDELKGKLTIKIDSNANTYVKGNDKWGILKRKEHINEIELRWLCDAEDENKVGGYKAVAEELQPNQNLKRLSVSGYRDVEKPSWAIDDKLQTSLPNLVKLELYECKGLEDLPMLSRFQFLKVLSVVGLENLEYMEKGSSRSYGGEEASSGAGLGLFPSLEVLELWGLPKMKGWWRGDGDDRCHMSISFPCLLKLFIGGCPMLTYVPLCPTVEELTLFGINERIKIMKKKRGGVEEEVDVEVREVRVGEDVDVEVREVRVEEDEDVEVREVRVEEDVDVEVREVRVEEDVNVDTPQLKLREVYTDDIGYLMKLPIPAAFQSLSTLYITGDKKVENMREVEDVFKSCSSSLQTLAIVDCSKLESIGGALEHLTALQRLALEISCDIMKDEMKRSRLEEEDEIPWTSLQHTLHLLKINYMSRGIRHLTSLQTLSIENGSNVETIPEWFTCLSSLQSLKIYGSSEELRKRCKNPNGEDWPKIQHISRVCIG